MQINKQTTSKQFLGKNRVISNDRYDSNENMNGVDDLYKVEMFTIAALFMAVRGLTRLHTLQTNYIYPVYDLCPEVQSCD